MRARPNDRVTQPRPASAGRRAARLVPLLALALSGCVSVGPRTIPRDRFDYSTAITESWKRQVLLNIVKLRYLDPPIFVDVGQIIAGYSLEAAISLGGTESSEGAVQGDFFSLGGSGRYVDRPTITYTPLTGSRFVENLMTPFPPEAVFSTIQSGWPADVILFSCVASINGLKNTEVGVAGVVPAEPRFIRLLELMRTIQRSGAVGMRVQRGEGGRRRRSSPCAGITSRRRRCAPSPRCATCLIWTRARRSSSSFKGPWRRTSAKSPS